MTDKNTGRRSAHTHNNGIPPLLVTIPEIIEASRTSRATVYAEIKKGRLKTVTIGRRRFATPEAAKEWIDRLSAETGSEVA